MANFFKNNGFTCTELFQDLVVVPVGNQIVVHSLYLCNIDPSSTDRTASIQVHTASGDFPIEQKLDVYPGTPVAFDKPINLEPGDSLQVKASAENSVSAFISYLEVTP